MCNLQKEDIVDNEKRIKDLQDEMFREKLEADQKLSDKTKEYEEKNKELVDHYTVRTTKLFFVQQNLIGASFVGPTSGTGGSVHGGKDKNPRAAS